MKKYYNFLFLILGVCALTYGNGVTQDIVNSRMQRTFPIDAIAPIEVPFKGNSEYLKEYFSHLDTNYIKNYADNCVYTSIGMLLGYYDSYWNDSVVATQYESQATVLNTNDDYQSSYYTSPGIDEPMMFNSNNYIGSNKKYQFAMDCMANSNSFLGLLLQCADAQHILEEPYYVGYSDNNYFNVKVSNITKIMDEYANRTFAIQGKLKAISYEDKDKSILRAEVIGLINRGIPVLATSERHAYICYEYNEDTDSIYIHSGAEGKEHVNLDEYSELINGYRTFTFFYYDVDESLRHSHSNNYYDNSKGEYMCSCELESHRHIYNGVVVPTDDTKHWKRCICMITNITEDHAYKAVKINNKDYAECAVCRHTVDTEDTPVPIIFQSPRKEDEAN